MIDIHTTIMEQYDSMNKSEKLVAQKVLDCAKEIVHMSISELSCHCSVSDTTVFRFCNRLGFTGYQDFKVHLALGIVTPMENIHRGIKENDDMYIIMQKVLKASTAVLEKTVECNNAEKIEELVQRIIKAHKICFWGNGGSSILAEDAYHKFYRLGLPVETASDIHWQYMQGALLTKKDLVFLFSSSGANKDLISLIDYIHEKDATAVGITQHMKSPLGKKVDICLFSAGNTQEFRSEAMESRLSTLLLIDSIFIRCAVLLKEKSMRKLHQIREGIAQCRI